MQIISAEQRMAETRGPKILIVGPTGVGKTSLLRTVNPAETLYMDLESGDLAVQDVPVDQVRPRTWDECRDLACYLGGANANLSPEKAYSAQHYAHVVASFSDSVKLDKYALYFIDSITQAGRLCLTWCQQQPEAFNEKGKPDMRGAYGLLGREMLGWIAQLQHAKEKAVVFVGILEAVTDDFKRVSYSLQIDGSKAGRELPGIVDEVIGMSRIQFEGDDKPRRVFMCTDEALDLPGFTPKDRSGRLETYEPPHLGRLIEKLTARFESEAAEAA